MSDLVNYYNVYANLSQASYKGRPQSKSLAKLDDNQLKEMEIKICYIPFSQRQRRPRK